MNEEEQAAHVVEQSSTTRVGRMLGVPNPLYYVPWPFRGIALLCWTALLAHISEDGAIHPFCSVTWLLSPFIPSQILLLVAKSDVSSRGWKMGIPKICLKGKVVVAADGRPFC